MSAPLIGLSTYREVAAWGAWKQSADLLPSDYARAVEAAGGVPILLPPTVSGHAARVVSRLDGLIIAGGADVSPSQYGAEPHARTANWRPDRDAWELALLAAADTVELPVFGICRGMQLMAVHRGGRLHQHVPDLVGHETHSPGGDEFGRIDVDIVPGTRLAQLVGFAANVGCHHHQSVADHPGYVASAYAADGTLEAMEAIGPRFEIAVQWHPETEADAGMLAGFIGAAKAYADR